MRDTWGPPRDGWPTFDDEGKRVTEPLEDMTGGEFGNGMTVPHGAMLPTQPRGMGKRSIETVARAQFDALGS